MPHPSYVGIDVSKYHLDVACSGVAKAWHMPNGTVGIAVQVRQVRWLGGPHVVCRRLPSISTGNHWPKGGIRHQVSFGTTTMPIDEFIMRRQPLRPLPYQIAHTIKLCSDLIGRHCCRDRIHPTWVQTLT